MLLIGFQLSFEAVCDSKTASARALSAINEMLHNDTRRTTKSNQTKPKQTKRNATKQVKLIRAVASQVESFITINSTFSAVSSHSNYVFFVRIVILLSVINNKLRPKWIIRSMFFVTNFKCCAAAHESYSSLFIWITRRRYIRNNKKRSLDIYGWPLKVFFNSLK